MKDKELLFEIFSRNKDKCLDLFGKTIKKGKLVDTSDKGSRGVFGLLFLHLGNIESL